MSQTIKCICMLLVLWAAPHLFARSATVTVFATTTLGQKVNPEIHLIQLGTKKDFWPANQEQSASNIPFSYYTIEVRSPGYSAFIEDIELIAEHTDIRAVLLPSMEAYGGIQLSGHVIHAKEYNGLWVLVYPLSGSPSKLLQARVDSNGQFKLNSSRYGEFLLVLVNDDRFLHAEPLTIRAMNSEIEVDAAQSLLQPK
jgi:hypothetical protein